MKIDEYKNNLITILEFTPKENSVNIYQKKYSNHNNYILELDFDKNIINFGESIFFNDSASSIQKISKAEDLVVLECVDRLLIKGYKPKNIILEKVYPSGHGTSGRLDILVTHDDKSAYMMVECKTWGKEFETAFKKLKKDGGQLFTYFQQDKDTEVLVLYASQFNNDEIQYTNQIIKIEDEYRATSNVKDFFDRWNKSPKNNGVFDNWTTAYNFKSKALTPKELVDIKQEDSSFIFNRFMEILRHNVVSDKPNAFNKIFTLFLCKIMDEKSTKPNQELEFQWLEGLDDDVKFQKRLTDLYQRGMKEFLDKEVTDLSDKEFEEKFGVLDSSIKDKLLEEFTKIRLQKNNEFAIKDVFDQVSFDENAIVVKEIVQLLQGFKIRYTKKQQFLSDFFELLLTTGLKQEVGQFFTPVPIAKFIIKSIPFDKIIDKKLLKGERNELLPNVIDYAVGSGHFITEAMDEIQKYVLTCDTSDFVEDTANEIESWKIKHFNWAYNYIYGIEKDYRLVKTAKVGCYLHGDGLAKVIHGDGLSNFTQTKEYKGKLVKKDKNYPQDNKQFDVVVSNPPYSVSAFKNVSKSLSNDDFELYDKLTDQSSEIEALFVERTKQLLRDGGTAGIILPSSILNNTGIYTKTREIIFKYFDIVSITELGSNTFMATGTNTVVLFLRRKNNANHTNIKASVDKLFDNKKDITINGIQKPLAKYINHVWEDISLDDYLTLLDKNPNDKIKNNELYQEYHKKLEDISKIISLENEKLFYFISAYPQKVTLVKTGEKKAEKKFLGYEFSARRGSEGIHPIQRSKTIDECTSLYDESSYTNSLKANSYIYSAFNGELKTIDESLKDNISYVNLTDMMTFDRVDFEKNISLSVKKKIKYSEIWGTDNLSELSILSYINKGTSITKEKTIDGAIPVIAGGQIPAYYHNEFNREKNIITVSASGAYAGYINYFNISIYASDCNTVKSKNENNISTRLIYIFLKRLQPYIYDLQRGQAQPHVYKDDLSKIKIPLPPKKIQEKIVKEIELLEKKTKKLIQEVEEQKSSITTIMENLKFKKISLENISVFKNGLNYNKQSTGELITIIGVGDFKNNFYPNMKTLNKIQIEGTLNDSYILKVDDILMVRSNGSENLVGRFLYVNELQEKTSFSGFTIRIRSDNQQINSKFLCHYLRTDLVRNLLVKDSKGSNIKSLNQGLLSLIKVPLPSLIEQDKIVLQIESIEKNIQIREQELATIPQQKEDILDKYLK